MITEIIFKTVFLSLLIAFVTAVLTQYEFALIFSLLIPILLIFFLIIINIEQYLLAIIRKLEPAMIFLDNLLSSRVFIKYFIFGALITSMAFFWFAEQSDNIRVANKLLQIIISIPVFVLFPYLYSSVTLALTNIIIWYVILATAIYFACRRVKYKALTFILLSSGCIMIHSFCAVILQHQFEAMIEKILLFFY